MRARDGAENGDSHSGRALVAGLSEGRHAAGDVLDPLVTARLKQTGGDGTAIAAAADDRDRPIVRQIRELFAEEVEQGHMSRAFDVTALPFGWRPNIDDERAVFFQAGLQFLAR